MTIFDPHLCCQTKTKHIEATEVFKLIMENFLDPHYTVKVSEKINKDLRNLSSTSVWLLRRRGFRSSDIPKLGIV